METRKNCTKEMIDNFVEFYISKSNIGGSTSAVVQFYFSFKDEVDMECSIVT